jgi:glucokinase
MAVVGIDLGGTNVRAGLVEGDRLGDVAAAAIPSDRPQDEVLAAFFGLVDRVVRPGLQGIGVGVPSVVDLKTGVIYDVQNIPAWKEVPLEGLIEARYGVPAYVNNDANCFAVGELYFGKARGFRHAVGLIVGTGLGAGVIANGRLYAGANCGAGEFGMLPYRDKTFEDYACGRFFKDVHGTSGRELHERAARGDAEALAIFREFGAHLGEAVKAILFAVDPEIIVLGGSVSKAYRFYKDSLEASVRDFPYSITARNIKFGVSETEHIAILGAAALYFDARKG